MSKGVRDMFITFVNFLNVNWELKYTIANLFEAIMTKKQQALYNSLKELLQKYVLRNKDCNYPHKKPIKKHGQNHPRGDKKGEAKERPMHSLKGPKRDCNLCEIWNNEYKCHAYNFDLVGGGAGGNRGVCLDYFFFYFIISIFLLWVGPTRGGEGRIYSSFL
jgi:hypothetical protein